MWHAIIHSTIKSRSANCLPPISTSIFNDTGIIILNTWLIEARSGVLIDEKTSPSRRVYNGTKCGCIGETTTNGSRACANNNWIAVYISPGYYTAAGFRHVGKRQVLCLINPRGICNKTQCWIHPKSIGRVPVWLKVLWQYR